MAGLRFQLRVTDSQGQSDRRWYVLNPQPPAASGAKDKPQPPTGLVAVAGDGCVDPFLEAQPLGQRGAVSAQAVRWRRPRSSSSGSTWRRAARR